MVFNDPFSWSNDPFNSINNHNSIIDSGSSHFLGHHIFDQIPDNNIHFVHPHMVNSYIRADGTLIHGYWRDGDGNAFINRTEHHGGGYFSSNPDGNPFNNLNFSHAHQLGDNGHWFGNEHFCNFDLFDHFNHGHNY